jgi:hypothetical protein
MMALCMFEYKNGYKNYIIEFQMYDLKCGLITLKPLIVLNLDR